MEKLVGQLFNGLVCWGKSTGNHGLKMFWASNMSFG
jgi:hypothetical protein